MSTVIYHNHHIIPKYRCKEIGIHPDFEGNVIRLTRLEHAEAHYHRWLKHKDPRDLGAAQLIALGEIDGIDFSGKNHPRYGKKHSQETIKKMSEVKKGKVHSAETRKKMSLSSMGDKNPLYGKVVTEETRKKISEANKGRKHTPEARKKISEAKKGTKYIVNNLNEVF